MKIVFLGSGEGGNLKFIHRYYENKINRIVGVIVDRQCGALNYAQKHKIPYYHLAFNRENNNTRDIIEILEEMAPDLIITTIHRILDSPIVRKFEGKLINLHYSYLPAFKGEIGMAPVNKAISLNNAFIGTTCHYVNEIVDSGQTISQGFFSKKNCNDVYQKTFECGALTLLSAILSFSDQPTCSEKNYNGIHISPGIKELNFEKCNDIFDVLQTQNI